MRPHVAVLFALVVSSSNAPAATWLSSSRSPAGVSVRWKQGSGFSARAGEQAPRAGRVIVQDEERRDVTAQQRAAAPDVAMLADDAGGLMVGAQSPETLQRLSGPEADDLFEDLGLEQATRMRLASGAGAALRGARVRMVLCDKLWIDGDQQWRARRELGLPLEIVPRRDPADVSRLRLDVLFRGRPVANALVRAWRQPRLEADHASVVAPFPVAPFVTMRTNVRGRVRLDVAPYGRYLVATSHALPSRERLVADWEVWQASLAFTREGMREREGWSSGPLRGTGLGTNPDLGDPGFGWPTTRRDRPGWGRAR